MNKKGLITLLLLFLAMALFANFAIFSNQNNCNCDDEKEEDAL